MMTGATAMIAVCAMACQFALLRLAVPGAPSTAVMTGNVTNTVLSLLDTVSPHPAADGRCGGAPQKNLEAACRIRFDHFNWTRVGEQVGYSFRAHSSSRAAPQDLASPPFGTTDRQVIDPPSL